MTKRKNEASSSLTPYLSLSPSAAFGGPDCDRRGRRPPDRSLHGGSRVDDGYTFSRRKVASVDRTHAVWARCALSLRPKPPITAMALAQRGQPLCHFDLVGWLGAVVLLPRELRQLRRDLRIAGGGNWLDDVDVDVHNCGAARS